MASSGKQNPNRSDAFSFAQQDPSVNNAALTADKVQGGQAEMGSIPARVNDRIVSGLKAFQPVIISAKSRDVNESDTVTITVDMLASIFGYDKYSEITSEHSIRGTYCDLAIKVEG